MASPTVAPGVAANCWSMVVALTLAVSACGGGGGGSDDQGPPVTITLTATAVNPSSVDVSWTAVTVATRYELHVNGSFFGSSATSGSVRLTTLSPGTRYCFIVYAVSFPVGTTDRSNEVCLSTPADRPPAAPGGLTAIAITPARIDLAWSAATDDWGIPAYEVRRDGSLLATVNQLAHSDAAALPGTNHCYTITAVDTAGNRSSPSTPACATARVDSQPPSTPTGLGATPGDTTVSLAWNASTDDGAVASYRIYRDGLQVHSVPAPDASPVQATDANLATYTQYCYQVVAVDRGGNTSSPSTQACTTTSWQRSLIAARSTSFEFVGERNALAVDRSGTLHVAYSFRLHLQGGAELRYAHNQTGVWSELPIGLSFDDSDRPSIAVDADSRAHLAFADAVNGFPWYLPISGTGASQVATEVALGTSIALDGNGQPQIAFGRSTGLRHAVRTAGEWSVIDVPGVAASSEPTLSLDTAGDPHSVFSDQVSQTLHHATRKGGTWDIGTIEASNAAGWHDVAAAVDSTDAVHASYYDGSLRHLRYATKKSGAWVGVTVDETDGAGVRTAIATDASGAAHISYVDMTSGLLKYATNAGGSWKTYALDYASFGSNGWGDTSIAIDTTGRIHIVYFQGGSLRWVTRP